MPVTETQAKLWFNTEEERNAYDDKMISNIELKSLDYEDENFSPVFSRATQETFLQPSERAKSDLAKIMRPLRSLSLEQAIDKYVLIKPDHTHYRELTWEKFFAGFGIGYLVLRELPLRNFYARCLVMYAFAAKLLDHVKTPIPNLGGAPNGHVSGARDRWHHWDIRCYDNAWRAVNFVEIPNANNKVRESKIWFGKQPGHIQYADLHYVGHFFGHFLSTPKPAFWDGTMNMPIHRLADPKHKDSYMMRFY